LIRAFAANSYSFHSLKVPSLKLKVILAILLSPDKIMFTMHQERWTDNKLMWTKPLIMQKLIYFNLLS
ncbi:MAG: hypothetical protein ABIJ40_15210, partial [Bacteroidota bacterium]